MMILMLALTSDFSARDGSVTLKLYSVVYTQSSLSVWRGSGIREMGYWCRGWCLWSNNYRRFGGWSSGRGGGPILVRSWGGFRLGRNGLASCWWLRRAAGWCFFGGGRLAKCRLLLCFCWNGTIPAGGAFWCSSKHRLFFWKESSNNRLSLQHPRQILTWILALALSQIYFSLSQAHWWSSHSHTHKS